MSKAPTLTKTQLVDENIRLRAECACLEATLARTESQLATLRTEYAALGDKLLSTTRLALTAAEQLDVPRTESRRRTPEHALPAHMAAARELAMRSGRPVRVG